MCAEEILEAIFRKTISGGRKKRQRQTVSWDIIYFSKWEEQKSSHLRFLLKFHFISFRCFSFRQHEETSRLLPTLNKQKGHFLLCHFMFHFQFHYSFYKLSQCAFKAFLDSRMELTFLYSWFRIFCMWCQVLIAEGKFVDRYRKVVKSFTIALMNFCLKFSLKLFKFFLILMLENSESPSHH